MEGGAGKESPTPLAYRSLAGLELARAETVEKRRPGRRSERENRTIDLFGVAHRNGTVLECHFDAGTRIAAGAPAPLGADVEMSHVDLRFPSSKYRKRAVISSWPDGACGTAASATLLFGEHLGGAPPDPFRRLLVAQCGRPHLVEHHPVALHKPSGMDNFVVLQALPV
jgi:hypothetical protein